MTPSRCILFSGLLCHFLTAFRRFAGVTWIRCLLLEANTPWSRVRLILVLGTCAASSAIAVYERKNSTGAFLILQELVELYIV